MLSRWTPLNLLFVVFLLSSPNAVSASGEETPEGALSVVASVAPVHGLVARVMAGIGSPELLISQSASPHTYTLKPSDAKMLSTADAVFWIGRSLETSLDKSIRALAEKAQVASLMSDRDRGVNLLNRRDVGVMNGDGHSHDSDEVGTTDPHIWLDPQNAAAMMLHIGEVLAGVDPENAIAYLSNAHEGAAELDVLSRDITQQLLGLDTKNTQLIFFHDAYQYFEHRFSIESSAIIQIDPDHMPGARRIADIRSLIINSGKTCLFSEPHYSLKLITTLIDGSTAVHGELDPLGIDIPLGPNFYETMMRKFMDNFSKCLNS